MEVLNGEVGISIKLKNIIGKSEFAINSIGGFLFEGLAMYDYVSANNVKVIGTGFVASAATLPLIASEQRAGTANAMFLIHNPSGMAAGNSEEMQKTADALEKDRQRAIDIYAQHLTISRKAIEALMNEERIIYAEEALRIGLIKSIESIKEEDGIEKEAAKALFSKSLMKFKMKEEKADIKEEISGMKKMLVDLQKFVSKLSGEEKKMLVLNDVNGKKLDFGADVQAKEEIKAGVKCSVDGATESGEFTLNDGSTLVLEKGVVSEIREPKNEVQMLTEELEATKAMLLEETKAKDSATKAKEEIEAQFTSFKAETETRIADINTQIEAFNMKANEPTTATTPTEEKKESKGFSFRRKIS